MASLKPGSQPLKNPKHEKFVLLKLAGKKSTVAYVEAGFQSGSGTKQSAFNLLHEPDVQARLKYLLDQKYRALHMDVDEILARAAMIARSDVRALFDDDGALLNPGDLDETAAAAVAGIEVFEEFSGTGKARVKIGETKKVRLRDPMPAIRLLAEHRKLVKAPEEGLNALAGALADRLKQARERRRLKESQK